MTTHFPTVPVALALKNADPKDSEFLPPVILVVDQDPLSADAMTEILRSNGLAAITAPDGPAALEIVAVIPPQMLLSDLDLPGMDGFTLANEITRRIPDCEVILFSGQYSTSDMVTTLHAEGHDFLILTKPVRPSDMLARVFARLGRHAWCLPKGFPPSPGPPANL